MGAAGGLFQYLVDHAESQHVLGSDLHAVGDFLGLGTVAPQDRGGCLRRDHAVDCVFQHQHPIGGCNGDGAARHALAGDDRDIGDAEREACVGRAGDRFRHAALLGADAGIGTGGIHDRQHGNAESLGHLHQPDRLAIAFRTGHPEIVLDPRLGRSALFLADHANALTAEAAKATQQGLVISDQHAQVFNLFVSQGAGPHDRPPLRC